MNIFFGGVSILITLYTGWRYIPEILRGKIKPHAFSWLPWTILASVAFIIQIQNGEDIWGFGSLVASALVCVIVFLLSFKYGEKNITVSDTLSLIGSLVLIAVWITIQNDFWALVLICIIDALSFYPTWRKSWKKPKEENLSMYTLSSFKNFLSIFALQNPIFINWLYPLFLTLINLAFAVYLVWRRKIIKN